MLSLISEVLAAGTSIPSCICLNQQSYCCVILHIFASRPDSCSRESTPSAMRMWQKPTSRRNSSLTNSCTSAVLVGDHARV